MVRPGLDNDRTVISEVCQHYFDTYVKKHGQLPGRNSMIRDLEASGISKTKGRRDWERLKEHYNGHHTEERPVPDTTTREPHAPVWAEAAEVATLRRQVEQHAQEVRELRELVEVLSPRARPSSDEVPVAVGKMVARQATQERSIQALEGQVQALAGQMKTYAAAVLTVQDFLALLRTDEGWAVVYSMVRGASTIAPGKTLLRWCAELAGRELPYNDLHRQ